MDIIPSTHGWTLAVFIAATLVASIAVGTVAAGLRFHEGTRFITTVGVMAYVFTTSVIVVVLTAVLRGKV